MSGFSAPGFLRVTSSNVPDNGVYKAGTNIVGISSNSQNMMQFSALGGIGRASAFCFLLVATGGNVVAFRGQSTSGLIGAFDFSNSADTQCGAINMDQGAHTVTYNTSSDERGKPYRTELRLESARDIICALKVYDHEDERNLINGVGVLAQEAYSVLPRMVTEGDSEEHIDMDNPKKNLWMVDYSKAVPYLIAHCQLLQKQVDELKSAISQKE